MRLHALIYSFLQVNVAVKCLKAWNDKAFQQMQMEFIKEANAMSLLDHPHIIRLYGIVLSVPMMLVSFESFALKKVFRIGPARLGGGGMLFVSISKCVLSLLVILLYIVVQFIGLSGSYIVCVCSSFCCQGTIYFLRMAVLPK